MSDTTKTKHTPGPWKHEQSFGDREFVICGDVNSLEHTYIAVCRSDNEVQNKANAKLIAAAPELLEVLQLTYDWEMQNDRAPISYKERLEKALAAIKKATE